MKKLIMILAIVFIPVLLVIPGIIGFTMGSVSTENIVEMIPPEARNLMRIEDSNFDRGWFSSQAQVDIFIDSPELDGKPLQLLLDITHGPVLLTRQGIKFGLIYAEIEPRWDGQTLQAMLAEIPLDAPEIDISLLTGFNQSLQVAVEIGEFDAEEAGTSVHFAGLQGNFDMGSNQSARFALHIGEFTMDAPNEGYQFEVSGIDIDSRSGTINGLLLPTQANLSVPSIVSTAPFPMKVSQITAESRMHESSAGRDMLDVYQQIGVASIEGDFPLQSAQWITEINQINKDLIAAYSELISNLQNQVNAGNVSATVQMEQLGQQMSAALLQNGMEIKSTLDASAYNGEHHVQLSIKWAGLPGVTDFTTMDVNQALDALSIELELLLDEKSALKSPLGGMIDAYLQQGLLTTANEKISATASLIDGDLTINQEVLPLDELISL